MKSQNILGVGMTSQRTRDRLVERLKIQGVSNLNVLNALGNIPRHMFVDEALASRAYEDIALPIGQSQTISQPYVVARMTETVIQKSTQKVLEIGTGSGYQTAVLSHLVEKVFTVERISALINKSRKLLSELGYRNIYYKLSDGAQGWRENSPYDAIVVTAAPEKVPEELFKQLAIGGRMVVPVGSSDESQKLVLYIRNEKGFEKRNIEDVCFVPFLQGIE
jgi:protein-L-isoaspartate(D-aspartate) O-methyltransferase